MSRGKKKQIYRKVQPSLREAYDLYIKGTKRHANVQTLEVYIGDINKEVRKALGLLLSEVYITTKSLKHIHDDKPQREEIIDYMEGIIGDPDNVYRNKEGKRKRANFCFVRRTEEIDICCLVQIYKWQKKNKTFAKLKVVSAFKLDKDYLKDTEILWTRSQSRKV